MTGLGELFSTGDAAALVPCVVVAPAPVSLGSPVFLVIPSWDVAVPREAAGWMPRGALLPSVDDEGLAAVDLNGEAWLLVWMPS